MAVRIGEVMSSSIAKETRSLVVNGRAVTVEVPESTSLLTALRHDLGLKGTRVGCTEGYCGACTVLVDGRPVQSCSTPLWSVEGRAVTTIEGLGGESGMSPVQEAFLAEQAAQCGYCTNGIVMTVAGLLSQSPAPSRAEILEALDERHICRCGAHARILRAVDRAAATSGSTP
jgi:nicotinate dehydrogenase subunit A